MTWDISRKMPAEKATPVLGMMGRQRGQTRQIGMSVWAVMLQFLWLGNKYFTALPNQTNLSLGFGSLLLRGKIQSLTAVYLIFLCGHGCLGQSRGKDCAGCRQKGPWQKTHPGQWEAFIWYLAQAYNLHFFSGGFLWPPQLECFESCCGFLGYPPCSLFLELMVPKLLAWSAWCLIWENEPLLLSFYHLSAEYSSSGGSSCGWKLFQFCDGNFSVYWIPASAVWLLRMSGEIMDLWGTSGDRLQKPQSSKLMGREEYQPSNLCGVVS